MLSQAYVSGSAGIIYHIWRISLFSLVSYLTLQRRSRTEYLLKTKRIILWWLI